MRPPLRAGSAAAGREPFAETCPGISRRAAAFLRRGAPAGTELCVPRPDRGRAAAVRVGRGRAGTRPDRSGGGGEQRREWV